MEVYIIASFPPLITSVLSVAMILPPDFFIDSCYQGYDGNGHIAWPGSDVKIEFDCSPACRHLVLYNPLDEPYFAVEPATNANNGINLYSGGEPDSGVVVLMPGECMEASFTMRIRCQRMTEIHDE